MTTEKTVRMLKGKVVSDKMQGAFVIKVERQIRHPVYNKFIRRTTKLHVRDLENRAKTGDTVVIQQTRPLSKTIGWQLVEIKEQAQ